MKIRITSLPEQQAPKNFAHELGGYTNNDHNFASGGLYIQDELEKEMANGGRVSSAKAKEILRDGTANGHKLTDKQKRYFGWIAGGAKADGGNVSKTDPIYAKQYGQPTIFQPGSYFFQPGSTDTDNNYYYPNAVYNKAGSSNVAPMILGSDVGYAPYTYRSDLPPAGYRTINGRDTSFTYRNILKDKTGADSVVYSPGSRKDVQRSMNIINNPSGGGEPSVPWMKMNNAWKSYLSATGDTITKPFAYGGDMVDDFLTEYKNGGKHYENPRGGIPIGGKATVEEGEFKFKDDDGSEYIFSNRF